MNLLADESIESEVVTRLRNDGHDVDFIAELSPRVDDETVLRYANERTAVLLTADKDFGEMVYRLEKLHSGVVLIRLAGLSPFAKAEIVSAAFRNQANEMLRAFTVISPGIIRVRHEG
jgi:predicted nuclease of predicted toxin-antitoxin system